MTTRSFGYSDLHCDYMLLMEMFSAVKSLGGCVVVFLFCFARRAGCDGIKCTRCYSQDAFF